MSMNGENGSDGRRPTPPPGEGTPSDRLSDLFEKHAGLFDHADPAGERSVLPPGVYEAVVARGEVTTSRSGTDGYKLTFRVRGGAFDGRPLWYYLWFTDAAMPYTKRDLLKLGVTSLEQLRRPLPPGIRCSLKVAVHRADDGAEYNRVLSFTVTGRDDQPANPFPPRSPDRPAGPTSAVTPPAAEEPARRQGDSE